MVIGQSSSMKMLGVVHNNYDDKNNEIENCLPTSKYPSQVHICNIKHEIEFFIIAGLVFSPGRHTVARGKKNLYPQKEYIKNGNPSHI